MAIFLKALNLVFPV